eukprot:GGOE01062157.1.p1 GENE.GGOE01062157.1~~GGOE01062157.1.p1  ORF type:complete len:565 (-),score=146.01 GGOE01062157.1:418-2112(-)
MGSGLSRGRGCCMTTTVIPVERAGSLSAFSPQTDGSRATPDSLAQELERLRWLNRKLKAAVAQHGTTPVADLLTDVDDRLATLAQRREEVTWVRRRAMEDVVDTLGERIMHSLHTSNTLNFLESRLKEFVIGAAGDMVSTGEVNYDWTPYQPRSFGAELRPYFHVPAGYLNSASYGCCPQPVVDARSLWDVVNQQDPALWRFRSLMLRLDETCSRVASYVHADVSDVHFLVSSALGVATVARSQAWRPGDRLLLLSCDFARNKMVAQTVATHFGVQVVELPVVLPMSDRALVRAVKAKLRELGGNTVKLACFPHVTSDGWALPVKRLRHLCHAHHTALLVDGTLAVGQFPVNVSHLAADYYIGSLDRWLFAPHGVGFLIVQPLKKPAVFPLTVSYFAGQGYNKEFSYTGLQDFSTYLAVRQVLEFIEKVCGGLSRMQSHCLSMTARMVSALEHMWGTRALHAGVGPMRSRQHRLPAIPVPRGANQSDDTARRLAYHLAEKHQLFVHCFICYHSLPTLCVRLCVQVFNDVADAEALGAAVLQLEGNYRQLPSVPSHILEQMLAME